MRANELRINNWVFNTTTCEYMLVYPMMIHQLSEIERKHGSLDESNIKPIPLTEEMFSPEYFEIDTASGSYNGTAKRFVYLYDSESNNDNDAYGACCHFALYNGKFYYYTSIDLNYYGYLEREVKYLHEVQNIIFALTNTELPIKL